MILATAEVMSIRTAQNVIHQITFKGLVLCHTSHVEKRTQKECRKQKGKNSWYLESESHKAAYLDTLQVTTKETLMTLDSSQMGDVHSFEPAEINVRSLRQRVFF